QKCSILFFSQDWARIKKIKLHIKGTDFQLKVWKTLLEIPLGKLSTYEEIAQHIQKPKAARAVGTAIGSNPIAFLIPCHRVIQASGGLGGYMWGEKRKTAIIEREVAERQLYKNNVNLEK
ncbi:MAG TPA: methylated-DNA--[protein]-cysteine S-methyltransferase, partial [Fermentimonas sp.]|nr:methylated-DNA--[protein]-cysteine S-methyltransferase [Fermentimonas sp.]